MFDPKASQQLKASVIVSPNTSPGKLATPPEAVLSENRIRERAYELYVSRGREPGQDEQDWLRAEQEIIKHQL